MVTLRLYLNKRYVKEDGTCSMTICLTHKSRSTYLPTGISIRPEHWDARAQRVIGRADRVALTNELLAYKFSLEGIALRLTREGKLAGKTVTSIRDLILAELDPEVSEPKLKDAFDAFIAGRKTLGSKKAYLTTLNVLSRYDDKIATRTFSEITRRWVEGFITHMNDNGIKPNSVKGYITHLKAVFNYAINNDLTNNYPFKKIKVKGEVTAKRNLTAEQLRKFFAAEVKPSQVKYLEFFKLQFLLVGINNVDLMMAKHSDLVNGRLTYKRRKTGRLYDIKVEPEAMEIMNKYRGKEHLLCFAEKTKHYTNFSANLNMNLSLMRKGVTSYYARHSWATIAANDLDIQKDTIAAALGHGGNTVTDVYIDYKQKKVDEANRKVIDWVLYGKK